MKHPRLAHGIFMLLSVSLCDATAAGLAELRLMVQRGYLPVNGVFSCTSAPDMLISGKIEPLGTEYYPVTIACWSAARVGSWSHIRRNTAQPFVGTFLQTNGANLIHDSSPPLKHKSYRLRLDV